MESFPTLESLIQLVEHEQPGGDPLEQLTESVILSGRLADVADELVGRFVENARSSGATWAEIGECMGVSKQAAQKRFNTAVARRGGGGFFLTRFATSARHVVRRAVAHARDAGAARVGTEHLVLGLVDDPDSLAVRAIAGLGGSIDQIRSAAPWGTESNRRSRQRPRALLGRLEEGSGARPAGDDSQRIPPDRDRAHPAGNPSGPEVARCSAPCQAGNHP